MGWRILRDGGEALELRWPLWLLGAAIAHGLAIACIPVLGALSLLEPTGGIPTYVTLGCVALAAGGSTLLAGALAGAACRWRARRLLENLLSAPSQSTLRALTRREFEACVRELHRRMGYRAFAASAAGSRGVYLLLGRDRVRKVLVCKHWPEARPGLNELRELRRLVGELRAQRGLLLTSGQFEPHIRPADDLELLDGAAFLERVRCCSRV